MHDEHPVRSALLLALPLGLLLAAGWIMAGETARDALFAALKLVVIR